MTVTSVPYDYDLKNAISANRVRGLWRMMTGYHGAYLAATASLAVAATAKTATYLLLRYFVDAVLGQGRGGATLALIALGFLGLAAFEGGFSFLSGRLAAQRAEQLGGQPAARPDQDIVSKLPAT